MSGIGDNGAAQELKRRCDRRIEIFDQVAELQETLKTYKSEDKNDGFTEKAIAKVVRERRADAEQVLANLMFEAEVDVYRKANGLPTEIDKAAEIARSEASSVPEPKKDKKRKERMQ